MSHPYYGLNELREMFLSYFEQKNGHLRLPSFSLIPQNDKSLLLINAGMAPMKPWLKPTLMSLEPVVASVSLVAAGVSSAGASAAGASVAAGASG